MASSRPIRSTDSGGSGDGGVHGADGVRRHVQEVCGSVVGDLLPEDGYQEG